MTVDNSDTVSAEPKQREVVHPYDANLISSKKITGGHTLLLDLDVEHFFVRSTTNAHLMINTDLSDEALKEVVDVLAKHGILQEGIKSQLERDGHLSLRMPGMMKIDSVNNLPLEEAKRIEEKTKPVTFVQDVVNPDSGHYGLFQYGWKGMGTMFGQPIQWVKADSEKNQYIVCTGDEIGGYKQTAFTAEALDPEIKVHLDQIVMEELNPMVELNIKDDAVEVLKKLYESMKGEMNEQD